ncbi:MAG: hypothetical protein JWR67_475 [Mucilaginibacter sp.]|nr:hypothetical protein [Mucilaginibacter sp.]
MNIISLSTAIGCAVLIFIVGSYERIYRMPKWFENPPQSFGLIAPQTKKATIFWIPVQLLFIVALIIAIITNWELRDVRLYLILALGCFIAVAALTGAYFVKEILIFSKMPATTPATPQLQKRAQQWLKWTTVRNVLQAVSLGLLVVALTKSKF